MALSVLKDIRRIYAGLNADEIRDSAAQEISVGLMASNPETIRRMERFLAPPAASERDQARALHAVRIVTGSPGRYNIVLCEPGIAVPRNGYAFESDESGSLVNLIVAENSRLETALGRTFPVFRSAAASRI